jgi:HAE1 family hydrophobic/amphiphilic exporter-1
MSCLSSAERIPSSDDDEFRIHLGLFPLVIAQGAGAATRHAVGTPVFGGMIAASVFGIFLIPLLYITAELLRNWRRITKH